jgi:predicted ATPase
MTAFGEQDSLVAIEQPEIHIHPKLQAELGDVFIESALGSNRNIFLLETHSEHLILRILRRIRETTEGDRSDWPDALQKACPRGIRPEDVAVLYVEPGEDGAKVIELPVDANGEFTCEWPGGFFEERIKELF